jgi:hypothetical protein
MRSSLATLTLILGLVTLARPAAADYINPHFSYVNGFQYGYLYPDERSGGIVTGYNTYSPDAGEVARLGSLTAGPFDVIDGRLDISSGPLISSFTNSLGVIDTYAAGGHLVADWTIALPNGATRDIHFAARLGPWNPLIVGTIVGGGGQAEVEFYQGMFDPDDAAFFGIPANRNKGFVQVYLDYNGGYENDASPVVREYRLFGDIVATAVPEPATTVFAVYAIGAWVLRRRRAQGVSLKPTNESSYGTKKR